MPKKYFSFSQKGFSIIELLVVIFIVALLSGLVLVGFFSGQKRYAVSRAAQLLAADLRRAQNFAITGKIQGATVPAGYGLYISSASQYKLFYNNNTNKQYNASSITLETISLADAAITSAGIAKSIYFTPPEPVTYINGAASGSQIFTITSNSYSKTVTVDASGRISID